MLLPSPEPQLPVPAQSLGQCMSWVDLLCDQLRLLCPCRPYCCRVHHGCHLPPPACWSTPAAQGTLCLGRTLAQPLCQGGASRRGGLAVFLRPAGRWPWGSTPTLTQAPPAPPVHKPASPCALKAPMSSPLPHPFTTNLQAPLEVRYRRAYENLLPSDQFSVAGVSFEGRQVRAGGTGEG